MQKLNFAVIIIVIFMIISPAFVHAAERDLTSDYLYQYGIKLYKDGHVAEAIHELKKCLIVNPGNILAEKYLRKILQKHPSYETLPFPQSGPATDVSLKEIIEKKDAQLRLLRRQLREIQQDYSLNDAEILELKQQIDSRDSLLGMKDEQLRKTDSAVSVLTAQLHTLQADTSTKDARIKELQEKIKGLEIATEEKIYEYAQMTKKETGQLLAVKDKDLEDKKSEINDLIKQLASAREQLNRSEKLSLTKEQQLKEITGLTNQLNTLKEKLEQSQQENSAHTARIKTLQEKSAALENSLGLQLKAKEQQLAAKEKEAQETEDKLSNSLAKAQEENYYLREEIQSLKDTSATQLSNYDNKIAGLEKELAGKNKTLELIENEKQALALEKTDTASAMEAQIAELKETMDKLKQGLRSEIDSYQAKLEMAQKGIVVRVLTDVLFDSGSAQLTEEGKKILSKISDVLGRVSAGHHIMIEGHTDNEPIQYSKWKSNWELSAARALSVLYSVIKNSGLKPERFHVTGFGEYSPISNNYTKEGRKQNRRVEIIIQPKVIKVKNKP